MMIFDLAGGIPTKLRNYSIVDGFLIRNRHTHVHSDARRHTHTHTHRHRHAHTRTDAHTRIHTHAHRRTHICNKLYRYQILPFRTYMDIWYSDSFPLLNSNCCTSKTMRKFRPPAPKSRGSNYYDSSLEPLIVHTRIDRESCAGKRGY